ncbi:MAG: MFS transporter [Candidatus Saccharibacteria bacterium]|nr:MFS transporter [Candidatus Saccharibacteria bacterium]
MKKWTVVIILASAMFVMVLDSTVMNVSISAVVKDLNTTVSAMQGAITFYTLTMAALMLLGGKLGDVWGRKRALVIGAMVYALGSLITALSQTFAQLFVGWSIIEGLGAVLVIPAIAALVATNYKGGDRLKAYAIIGGVSGAAAAAGPLIGGYFTTYLSWRYVFVGEVIIMAVVLLFSRLIYDEKLKGKIPKIDLASVLLSASGFTVLVFGMLQSKVWGWIRPRSIPTINGVEIAPFGISLTAWLILAGLILLYFFIKRQQKLERENKNPLVKVSMLKIPQLRSGLTVLMGQYLVIGAVFFVIPVYLQMTLGMDALQTGLKILPLSIALILFSIVGTRLAGSWSTKKIVKTGQYLLVFGVVMLIGSIDTELKNGFFAIGMFVLGGGLGLLASQLGNVNISSVPDKDSSEVGGVQGVFQNLGTTIGTALIGSVLVGALTTSFVSNIQSSDLPSNVKSYVQTNSQAGVAIVPVSEVQSYAESQGLSAQEAATVSDTYASSQVKALRSALFILLIVSLMATLFANNIPDTMVKSKKQ